MSLIWSPSLHYFQSGKTWKSDISLKVWGRHPPHPIPVDSVSELCNILLVVEKTNIQSWVLSELLLLHHVSFLNEESTLMKPGLAGKGACQKKYLPPWKPQRFVWTHLSFPRTDWEPPDKKVDTRKYRAEPRSIYDYQPGKSSVLNSEKMVMFIFS